MVVPPGRPPTPRRIDWWHLAVSLLVAPFVVGLFVVTAIGAAFTSRTGA